MYYMYFSYLPALYSHSTPHFHDLKQNPIILKCTLSVLFHSVLFIRYSCLVRWWWESQTKHNTCNPLSVHDWCSHNFKSYLLIDLFDHFRDGGTSWYETLFEQWAHDGHWLHIWDDVVIKQTHAKYGIFISTLAGSILAYNSDDMKLLISAIGNGVNEKISIISDADMLSFVKPYQAASYVRRVTRGVQVSYLQPTCIRNHEFINCLFVTIIIALFFILGNRDVRIPD